jgi:hypothetical protein
VELSDHIAQVHEDSENSLSGPAKDGERRIAVGQQHIIAIHHQPRLCKGDARPKTTELADHAPQRLQRYASPPEFRYGAKRYYIDVRVSPTVSDARLGRREAGREKSRPGPVIKLAIGDAG